ncbi:MAG TPA: GTPase [Streptosporangiaceae bacterium]|nr:GTPase [Streptosporangiaceae bacterium]
MTERQEVAAAPAPWVGAGGPLPASQDPAIPHAAPTVAGADELAGSDGAAASSSTRQDVPGDQRAGPGYRGTPAGNAPASVLGRRPADAGDEPAARVDARKLESALLTLRKPIVSVPLPLEAPGVAAARAERLKLLGQIDDYLLPRLRQSGAPILVALVGSTGAGKSTLMNSLAGRQVSATGIRRPTTNSPVLACHPNDMRWFAENVFLPTLPRVRQQGLAMPGRDGLLVLAATEGMPEGVAVLDTPDIDSVVQAHRDFANQFLDASDLWLFVTTARRYADAAVWEMLKDARDRGAALAVALSRVPPPAARQLAEHFDAMLDANGLGDIRRFIIPETIISEDRLPADVAEPVQEYLADTARREDRRVAVLTQTMAGVLDTFRERIPALAAQAASQLAVEVDLRAGVEACYATGLAAFDEAVRNGSILDGEVLARWQDFAGTGDLLRTLQARRGRGRVGKGKKQRLPARATALKAALQTSLESLIVSIAATAAEHAISGWQQSQAGAALLAGLASPVAGPAGAQVAGQSEADFVASALADLGLAQGSDAEHPVGQAELERASAGLADAAAKAIRGWQQHVRQLVRGENVTRRSIARVVSFDDQSLALVLTIGVLGYGGAPDAQDDAQPGAVPQNLLTSLFGAGLLRDIGVRVRQDLHDRVGLLLEEEASRFAALLDAVAVPDEAMAAELLEAGYALESAR